MQHNMTKFRTSFKNSKRYLCSKIMIAVCLAALILNASILQAETLRVAIPKDYYPYYSLSEEGKAAGIIVDIWELWSRKTGISMEFVPLNHDTVMQDIASGKTDVIAGIFYSEDKARLLDFTDEIIRVETVLFIKKHMNISSIEKSDVVTGVVEADYLIDFLRNRYPGIKLEVFNSYTDLRNAVNEKKIDAFVYAFPKNTWLTLNTNIPDGYKTYSVLYTERIRAGVKKGNIKLLTSLNKGMILMTDNDLTEIGNKWEKLLVKSGRFIMKEEEVTILELILLVTASLFFSVLIIFSGYRLYSVGFMKKNVNLRDLIDGGENDTVEFKSSLRWDYRENAVNKTLEQVIIKTIAAFLNTKGGTLLIGVADDGTVPGLENDYRSFTKKQSRDGFILALTSLINQHIGKDFHRYISINIRVLEGKDVCVVTIRPGNTPVFLGSKEKEEFYIRAAASSQSLSLSETHKYIDDHWKK